MATSEIDGSYGLPRYVHTFTDKLQQMLHDVGGKIIDNVIKPASSQRYACRLIQPANKNEEGSELQKKRTRRGMIQISGLIHKMENKSDPILDWFMFHKIYYMYSDINNKEEQNTAMILTSMSEHEEANIVNEELEDSRDNDDNNQPILQENIIPSDLNDIQPRATQVWNCNSFGFVPNVR